ncbi:DUF5666 domain-containing protein [Synechococcus elongatus]|uniref:DUF5666 domain-containing protein n=1 Tax=Synechococcus elongatus TaxID=32046 RepID=UPI000F7F9AAB|nr:DUF5666 domain-containing protein [Synechococcus elongatus]
MKSLLLLAIAGWITFPLAVAAKDDFYGIIQQRPSGKVGTWTISGQSIQVTEQTQLQGQLVVGSCVEVDFENDRVDEIEAEPMSKCS